jgi:hypothetical protein
MAEKRGYGAIAAGFVLVLFGFVLILYEIWSTATIPINNYTLAGVAIAGIGVAVGAVGLDRGIEIRDR